jgi:hypothetical protein
MARADAKTDRAYRCSFCGKSQIDVKVLIFGPGVGVCNECVTLCNNIIAATPEASDGKMLLPDNAPTEQLMKTLAGYNTAFESVDNAMQGLVDILREREVSWAAIGETLGVSRQAAWKRFG